MKKDECECEEAKALAIATRNYEMAKAQLKSIEAEYIKAFNAYDTKEREAQAGKED